MTGRKITLILLGLFAMLSSIGTAWAGSIYVNSTHRYRGGDRYYGSQGNPNYYADPYYGSNVVIIERGPVLVPRYGSNDHLYTYDNIYGPGASAAGRMSHSVNNPQPQFFYAY